MIEETTLNSQELLAGGSPKEHGGGSTIIPGYEFTDNSEDISYAFPALFGVQNKEDECMKTENIMKSIPKEPSIPHMMEYASNKLLPSKIKDPRKTMSIYRGAEFMSEVAKSISSCPYGVRPEVQSVFIEPQTLNPITRSKRMGTLLSKDQKKAGDSMRWGLGPNSKSLNSTMQKKHRQSSLVNLHSGQLPIMNTPQRRTLQRFNSAEKIIGERGERGRERGREIGQRHPYNPKELNKELNKAYEYELFEEKKRSLKGGKSSQFFKTGGFMPYNQHSKDYNKDSTTPFMFRSGEDSFTPGKNKQSVGVHSGFSPSTTGGLMGWGHSTPQTLINMPPHSMGGTMYPPMDATRLLSPQVDSQMQKIIKMQKLDGYLFAKNFVAKQSFFTKIINSTVEKVKETKYKIKMQDNVKRQQELKQIGKNNMLRILKEGKMPMEDTKTKSMKELLESGKLSKASTWRGIKESPSGERTGKSTPYTGTFGKVKRSFGCSAYQEIDDTPYSHDLISELKTPYSKYLGHSDNKVGKRIFGTKAKADISMQTLNPNIIPQPNAIELDVHKFIDIVKKQQEHIRFKI